MATIKKLEYIASDKELFDTVNEIIDALPEPKEEWCSHNKNIGGVYTQCEICNPKPKTALDDFERDQINHPWKRSTGCACAECGLSYGHKAECNILEKIKVATIESNLDQQIMMLKSEIATLKEQVKIGRETLLVIYGDGKGYSAEEKWDMDVAKDALSKIDEVGRETK